MVFLGKGGGVVGWGGVGCLSVFWRLLGVFGEKGHFEVALVHCALLLR